MRSMKKVLAAVGLAATLALAGCGSDSAPDDGKARDASYDQMQAAQPAATMDYSPTRETINFWVETWSEPGKLSYIYLQNIEGDINGYYVLEGLPVSMCAQISPSYEIVHRNNSGKAVVPAPANDGVYYGEGDCNRYYGKDATTGSYIEYTAGMGNNPLLFSEPMPHVNHQELNALGDTEIAE